jgi:hypothetical protein
MNLTLNVLRTDGIGNPNVALSVDIGGITIGSTNNTGIATSLLAAVTDNSSVDISVSQTGYYPYTITIDNVYDVDKTIDIIMVPIETIGDPEYNLVTPAFFLFQDPNSFRVDAYIASSYAGNISWYVNNILYVSDTRAKIDFVAPGDYQVKVVTQNADWLRMFANTIQGNTVSGAIGALNDYLVLDTDTNVTVAEYRLDLSLAFTSATDPILTDDLTCYAKNETITVTPSWTITKPGATGADYNIIYTITDPSGTAVTLPTDTFPLDIPTADAVITFDMTELGTYKVQAKVVDLTSDNEYVVEYCLETCNFINIQYKDCNVYTVSNRNSAITFTYTLEQLNVVGSITTGSLGAGESVDFTFTNPGIFIMTADYLDLDSNPIQEKYVIFNHCEIENCLSDYITGVLCGGDDACAPCPPDNELNQILLLQYTYFMKVNEEYASNNFYTGLSEEKLTDLTSMEQILNKLSVFCNRRGCVDKSFSEGTKAGQQVYTWKAPGVCNCNTTNATPKAGGYCGSCGGSVKSSGCSSCS